MGIDRSGLMDRELTHAVIGAFFAVYGELGYGFLENVYENALVVVLRELGVEVVQQRPIDVYFRGHLVGEYRSDLIVESRLLVEIKAVDALAPTHEAQLLNYLAATGLLLGLILNFGPRPKFRRLIRSKASFAFIRSRPRSSA